jgi:hypothetical protein
VDELYIYMHGHAAAASSTHQEAFLFVNSSI